MISEGCWYFLMLAKAMTKNFIITEIWFGASFVILSYIFINHYYGVVEATYAFALNYLIYWITMEWVSWRYLRK